MSVNLSFVPFPIFGARLAALTTRAEVDLFCETFGGLAPIIGENSAHTLVRAPADTGGYLVCGVVFHVGPAPMPKDYALLAHEAVHVWDAILDHIGEQGRSSTEINAYHIQHISLHLMQVLHSRSKRCKSRIPSSKPSGTSGS